MAAVGQDLSAPAHTASIASNMVDYRKRPLRDEKY